MDRDTLEDLVSRLRRMQADVTRLRELIVKEIPRRTPSPDLQPPAGSEPRQESAAGRRVPGLSQVVVQTAPDRCRRSGTRATASVSPVMKGAALCLLLIALAGSGCSASPLAPAVPDTVEHRGAVDGEAVTMSGWVYVLATWADPPIADALIEVTTADGVTTTASSDANGYYELTVPNAAGVVSIRTSRLGYVPRSLAATLVKDTVLNFFLSPL